MCAPYVEARPKGGARAEKEIGEKAQKIIRYQIVSTYFLHGAFKVLFSAWRPVFSRLLVWQCVHPCYPWTPWRPVYIIRYAGTKKKVANLRALQCSCFGEGSNNFIQKICGWFGVWILHHTSPRHAFSRCHLLNVRLGHALSFFRFQSASGLEERDK